MAWVELEILPIVFVVFPNGLSVLQCEGTFSFGRKGIMSFDCAVFEGNLVRDGILLWTQFLFLRVL
jgi:hypothetical protein